ncbi:MAG TPA: polyprenyl synthetase family protein [Chloroflexota bacterium]|nr:polyprenyl synthetase family protein [Chloroflexota bacterium]
MAGQSPDAAAALFARYQPEIQGVLRDSIPSDSATPDLYDLLRYHLGWLNEQLRPTQRHGGKMLRSTLCLLCTEASNGGYRRALPAAAAVELLHNFSLIHDDVEDHGAERRGRQTVWARWGEPLAVNAGDALLILSELALLRAPAYGADPANVLTAIRLLNQCCLALSEGQHLDLTLERNPTITREQYFQTISRKTAALLGCSAQIGVLCAGARGAQSEHYREFGTFLGLGFQIQDDLLGIWGDPRTTGKPAAADVYGHKVTLPVIEALARAAPDVASFIATVYRSASPAADDVRAVVDHLTALGVRELVEAEAASYIDRALQELDAAAPLPGPAADLRLLAQALVGRAS